MPDFENPMGRVEKGKEEFQTQECARWRSYKEVRSRVPGKSSMVEEITAIHTLHAPQNPKKLEPHDWLIRNLMKGGGSSYSHISSLDEKVPYKDGIAIFAKVSSVARPGMKEQLSPLTFKVLETIHERVKARVKGVDQKGMDQAENKEINSIMEKEFEDIMKKSIEELRQVI